MSPFRSNIFLLAIIVSAALQAQAGDWSAFTSMRLINDVLALDDEVWSATQGGVLHYDIASRDYTRYTRLDGLAGNQVLSVAIDERGDLWFGTNGDGLSRYRPQEGRFDEPILIFRDLRINALVPALDRIFVGTDKGISVFLVEVERVKENYRQLGGLSRDTEVTALTLFDNRLWAGTVEGVAWADIDAANLQDPDSWTSTSITGRVEDLLVFDGQIFCAGQEQIWVFNQTQNRRSADFNFEAKALGVLGGQAIAVHQLNNFYQRSGGQDWRKLEGFVGNVQAVSQIGNTLWAGTTEGLRNWTNQFLPIPKEPSGNHFFDMVVGQAGHLWVASVPNDRIGRPYGVYQFNGSDWQVHNINTGVPSDKTVAVETDLNGNLWVGTWADGVAVLDAQGQWHQLNQRNSVLRGITEPNAPSFIVISDIARDAEGLIWLTNVQAGLAVMDGFPVQRGLLYDMRALGLTPGRDVGKLSIDSNGLKWIATAQDGFILFDDGGTPFTAGDERAIVVNTGFDSRLSSNEITAIMVDASNRVWVGTRNGLHIIRASYNRQVGTLEIQSWRTLNLNNGLRSAFITALAEDADGNIWVGTKEGLIQFAPSGLMEFTFTAANSGLIDDQVEALHFDAVKGELWVGTFDGLGRLQLGQSGGVEVVGTQVYPNPFHPQGAGRSLTFAGLPLGASLNVFALDGRLVRQLEGEDSSNTATWDGRNGAGQLVGSGVYFYLIVDRSGRTRSGKFAVVRER